MTIISDLETGWDQVDIVIDWVRGLWTLVVLLWSDLTSHWWWEWPVTCTYQGRWWAIPLYDIVWHSNTFYISSVSTVLSAICLDLQGREISRGLSQLEGGGDAAGVGGVFSSNYWQSLAHYNTIMQHKLTLTISIEGLTQARLQINDPKCIQCSDFTIVKSI